MAGDHGPSQVAPPEPGVQANVEALAMRTRVLLIGDEEALVAHVRRILARPGFAFHSARTAREGLALATSIRPDAVLIDKLTPGLDGIALLRLMRRNASLGTVPVLVLSGHADEAACVAALREGADDFVTRQFSEKELVARIEGVVRLTHLRRDDERRMLARELHDQLGQVLTAARIDIRFLQVRLDESAHPLAAAEMSKELGAVLSSVDLAIASVQDIASLLRRPVLEEGGLVAALRRQAKDMQRRTGIECSVKHDAGGYIEPSPLVAGELLRMCQEALTNVLRHAGASRVILQVVMRGSCLLVRICDNGAGITRESVRDPASIGLQGMRERAAGIRASVRIHGRRGRGTMLAIRRRQCAADVPSDRMAKDKFHPPRA